jgi:hypothetical protein
LRRIAQVGPTDAREAPQIGQHGVAQLVQQASKQKPASASVRKASIASSRSRKLAVNSTRYSAGLRSATRLGCRLGLGGGATALQLHERRIGLDGPARRDVREAAARIVDQQQVDALALQAVVVVQALAASISAT